MKILFITANGIEDAAFGGAKASIRNYKSLKNFGNVDVYTVKRKSSIQSALSLFRGWFPPINNKDVKQLKMLSHGGYDIVFFDGSIFGKLIDIFNSTKTVVFYHNCEHDFNSVRFGNKNRLKKYLYQKSVDRNEKYITCLADYRITLSERDTERILNLYGKKADLIVPLGIEDKFTNSIESDETKVCLLLGAVCEANIAGYEWFVNNVSPFIDCQTVIAGKGFDKYKEKWKSEKVNVVGYVENLEKEYANASCVAIPLFSGGGMKVKTVEALMFGKTVFGTKEAFSGFDLCEDVTFQCDTKEEFICGINNYLSQNRPKYNGNSRKLYLNKYTIENSIKLFSKMIKDLGMEGK